MEKTTITVNGKDYVIRELGYKDGFKLSKASADAEATNTLMIELSVIEPKINMDELSLKEGSELIKKILEFNGMGPDFTKPQDGKQDTTKSG